MADPQAFPHVEPRHPDLHSTEPGMSLRDYFAGQALAGLAGTQIDDVGFALSNMAIDAYRIADFMLAARAKATGSR